MVFISVHDFKQGLSCALINLMIFCYGGVLGSTNLIIKVLGDGEGTDNDYFNLKLTEDQTSTIGISWC